MEDTNNSSDLSEFFSALSKEKKESRQKLEKQIANPESGLSNLFQQLEEAHRETQKVSEEIPDSKSLSPDDQNKLEAFSSLMNSVDVSLQEVQEETPEDIETVEPVVAEVFNDNSEKEDGKLEVFSKLFDGLAQVEEKQEPQEELVIEGETPKPQIVAQETNDIISDVISSLDAMESKTEVKEEVDQITSIRAEFEKFKNHIQQHISNQGLSGGGSGETRLGFLDDVDRDSAKVDGKALIYQASSGKWIGGDASGGSSAADDLTAGDAAVLLTTSSGNITIDAAANDSDIIFKGTDGGADITMLTLDGSADGAAIFKSTVTATGIIIGSTAVTSTAAELNILDGVTSTTAELNILDGVTSTAAELNVLDGITAVVGELNALDIGSTAIGTAVASKAVILDSNKDYSGIRNLTISGELDAATGDFSGDVDIDGTLEADAITVNGTSLAETISDTVGAMVGSNTETGITVTYQDDDNTLDFALAAAQTTITSLLATDIKIGEDDQTKIDFETADEIHFYAANEHQIKLVDGALVPATDNDIDLGTSSVEFKDAYFDGTVTADAFAGPLTGDVTGTADVATVATTVTITDNESTNESNALIFAAGGDVDGGNLGLESDGTLTYNPSTGIVTATGFAGALTGNVTGNVSGTAATVTGAAQTNITSLGTLTALTVDNVVINGATIGHGDDTDLMTVADGVLTVAGEVSMTTLDIGGTNVTSTAAELNILDGVTASAADINLIDGITNGTVIASKAIITDSNKDISGGRNITISGELDAATLDISGDADIDGTANLDAVDIDGTVQIDGVTTFGVDDTGVDVKFFGATSGAYLLWDESADKLLTAGSTTIDIVKDKLLIGSTAVTTTAAELNILDGVTSTTAELNILDGVTSTAAELNILDGVTSTAAELNILDGVTSTAAELNILDGVTTTAAEINLIDGDTSRGTTAVASGDGILINDAGTMRMTNVDTVSTYFSSHNVGGGNIVTTGALNSGSITSGFGAIDNGSSAITTTGTVTFGSLSDGTITATAFVDEDDMSSDSATLIPTQQSVKAYVDSQDFAATSFVIEDGDGTEVTITKNKEMKFIGDGITINWTDTDNGTDADPYDLTFTIDAAQTDITSLLATDIKIGEDDQTKIDFETADEIHFYAANEHQVKLVDGALVPVTDNDIDLGTSSLEFKDAYFDGTVTSDAFAGPLTGNVTGNVSGTAATVTGAAQSNITSLGTLTALTVDNVVINGSTIGHTDDADLITVANGIATVAGEVSMTTLDIGGTNVTSTATELNKLDGATVTTTEINYLDITTLGTSEASKAVTVDSNGDLLVPDSDKFKFGAGSDMQLYHDGTNSYITNGTGILKIATETSGIAINIGHGTSEVTFGDNVTVTGDFTVNGTTTTINTTNLTVTDPLVKFGQGYTGTAYDEGFIITRGNGSVSNTANKGFIWDESADEFAAIACNTEDGTTAGNVTINSYADLQIDKLTAGSLDISGDADIDGTLEADAMTLNGVAITTTATLSTGISNGNLPVFTTGVSDDDFLRVAGTSIEGRSAAEVLSDIGGQASLTFGISNTNAVKIDSASVADDEYARFTANGLESRSTAEVLSDIGGQASLTFGISNTNAVKIDSASVADDEYARFTANGLESRSTSEVLSDIGGQASLTFGISNTNAVKIDSASVADDEYARFTASGLESRSTAEVLSDIGASPVAGSGSIVTTGALDAGSITSGFGAIDNGSSTITTSGVITGGSLLVADAGTIGSASDTDAVAISSAGQVSFSATNAIKIPVGTTAQRPSNAAGLIRYNSTLGQFEGYTSAWGGLGGGATGGGADQVFVENSDDVTTNYTITSGKNAMSVGPITVESGVVVTIPSGSRWVVL